MTRDETIELWQRCEDARASALADGKSENEAHECAKAIWNSWAKVHSQSRVQLANARELELSKFDYETEAWIAPETSGVNEATNMWLLQARADFHGHVFDSKPNFSGFIFPGHAIFGESKRLTKDRTKRPSVVFCQGAEFKGAEFQLDAIFDWSQFERAAGFSNVRFLDIARFGRLCT